MEKFLSENGYDIRPEAHSYSISGLILPQADSSMPLVKLLLPYFKQKENFLLVTPPFDGKLDSILAIFSSLDSASKAIVCDDKLDTEYWVHPSDLQNVESYDHIVFYNTLQENITTNTHVSVFIDISRLADFYHKVITLYGSPDSNWLKSTASSLAADVFGAMTQNGNNDNYTVICSQEQQQQVEFTFVASENLVKACVDTMPTSKHTAVYSKNIEWPDACGYAVFKNMPDRIKCTHFIFAELPSMPELEFVLSRVGSINIIYTPSDFASLGRVVDTLSKRGIAIPDHVRQVMKSA